MHRRATHNAGIELRCVFERRGAYIKQLTFDVFEQSLALAAIDADQRDTSVVVILFAENPTSPEIAKSDVGSRRKTFESAHRARWAGIEIGDKTTLERVLSPSLAYLCAIIEIRSE